MRLPLNKWHKHIVWLVWLIFACLLMLKVIKFGGTGRSLYPLLSDSGRHWLAGYDIHFGFCHSFQYWPGFAVLFIPFNFLPDLAGSLIWSAISIFLFIYCAHRFSQTFFQANHRHIFLLALLPISYEGLINQQSNPIFAALIMLAFVNIKHRNWWLASFCFIFPAFVKVAPLCFALLATTCFFRKLSWRLLIMALAFIIFPFGYHNFEYVAGQYRNWLIILSKEDGQRWAYRDAWVLWELFVFGRVSHQEKAYSDMLNYRLLQLGMAGLAFFATALIRFFTNSRTRERCIQTLMWGSWWLLLFGPSTEVATCVMGAAGYATALITAYRERMGFKMMLLSYTLVAIGSSGDLEYEFSYLMQSDYHKGFLAIGGVLFGVYLLRRTGKKILQTTAR